MAEGRGRRPEFCEGLAGVDVPVDDQVARGRVGEEHPQQVAAGSVEFGEARVEALLRVVPRHELPVGAQHVRGCGHECIEEADQRARCLGRRLDRGGAGVGECEEVCLAGLIEPERPGDRQEHVVGGVDPAPLLEPGVPGDRHTGEQCHLLTAQPRRAAPASGGQADLFGTDRLAPGAEEFGQFAPMVPRAHSMSQPDASRPWGVRALPVAEWVRPTPQRQRPGWPPSESQAGYASGPTSGITGSRSGRRSLHGCPS